MTFNELMKLDSKPTLKPVSKEAVVVSRGSLKPRGTSTTKKTSKIASKRAIVLANDTTIIESIRKTVKEIGKETTFIRLTQAEKDQLVDAAYTYKRQGFKTSENELGRIGIAWLLKDYKINGKVSVLNQVLEALRA